LLDSAFTVVFFNKEVEAEERGVAISSSLNSSFFSSEDPISYSN
jgi:hypothetical protein